MSDIRGVTRTGSILDRIVADLVGPLEDAQRKEPRSVLLTEFQEFSNADGLSTKFAPDTDPAHDSEPIRIIAEIKKASPSRGILAEKLDHIEIARTYALAGATGISVVTEPNYFLGNLAWLRDIRRDLAGMFPGHRPSLLRKDFLVTPYEVLQSRAYGADNILLIVAILEDALLKDLLAEARELDLDALVEVHTEAEAEQALRAGATLFGINNRDLHTFEVDLTTTERIRPLLPQDAIVVGESGVHTRADVERLQRAGVRAILVGEAFMTSPNVAEKMAELRV